MRLKKSLLLSFISILTLKKSISNLSHASSIMTSMKKVPASRLGISEPPPDWFGNPVNVCSSNWTNKNWLKSRFHFSFAEYNNVKNQNFGVLRVMNDDLVQPERGFGEHPHRDVEICTYIVEGALTHKDSMGTAETLHRGDIQFMSAGSGITHSEHNLGSNPLRFIQIWITTRQRGIKPVYGSTIGKEETRLNQWSHLVKDIKDTSIDCPISINADANIFVAEIEGSKIINFDLKEGRQSYLLCVEGDVLIQGSSSIQLSRHDAVEIVGAQQLSFSSQNDSKAHSLMVEMKHEKGSGRTDL